ncbi:MAG: ribokinase [Nitrospinota bacterium]|nr:MAG: ribokinase [Nitrospinota bacterium]
MRAHIVVLGSANTDLTVKADRLPRPGETVTGGEFMVSYGGKGANQALAALKVGATVHLLAKIGTDAYGNLLYEHLIRSGLPPEGLVRDPEAPAGVALIAIDREGNNQIIVAPGSNWRFSVQDLQALTLFPAGTSLLLTQLEIPLPTVEQGLRLARAQGITTILNPAPATPLPSSIYPLVDILTPNEREAGDLAGMEVTGLEEAERAAAVLQSRGCRQVIVTLGAQGALLYSGGRGEHFPAFPVQAIDTVAAGDAFNGALAAALAMHRPLSEAIRFANAAGALSTTQRGAQESLPAREAIEQLMTRA